MTDQADPSGWKLVLSHDFGNLSPELQQRLQAKRQQGGEIELHIKLYDLGKGHSQISVQVAQGGTLAQALANTQTSKAAYNELMAAIQRELNDMLPILLGI